MAQEKEAVVDLTTARASTHGDFRSVAVIEQKLKDILRSGPNWDQLPDNMKCALEMIAHKQARILCGSCVHKDHWDDISGYAHIVARHL